MLGLDAGASPPIMMGVLDDDIGDCIVDMEDAKFPFIDGVGLLAHEELDGMAPMELPVPMAPPFPIALPPQPDPGLGPENVGCPCEVALRGRIPTELPTLPFFIWFKDGFGWFPKGKRPSRDEPE